jgi:hypothetical protein
MKSGASTGIDVVADGDKVETKEVEFSVAIAPNREDAVIVSGRLNSRFVAKDRPAKNTRKDGQSDYTWSISI